MKRIEAMLQEERKKKSQSQTSKKRDVKILDAKRISLCQSFMLFKAATYPVTSTKPFCFGQHKCSNFEQFEMAIVQILWLRAW